MAFMDDVLGKMSQAGQAMGQKAKDLSEYARLSSVISDSEGEINSLYTEIGYLVYKAYRDRPLPEVDPQIMRISTLNRTIEEARAAQKALTETEKCPRCGSRIQKGMKFCNNCGYRLAEPAPVQPGPAIQPGPKFCRACGAPLTEGASFCMSCGARVGVPAGAAPTAASDRPAAGPAAPASETAASVFSAPPVSPAPDFSGAPAAPAPDYSDIPAAPAPDVFDVPPAPAPEFSAAPEAGVSSAFTVPEDAQTAPAPDVSGAPAAPSEE